MDVNLISPLSLSPLIRTTPQYNEKTEFERQASSPSASYPMQRATVEFV